MDFVATSRMGEGGGVVKFLMFCSLRSVSSPLYVGYKPAFPISFT